MGNILEYALRLNDSGFTGPMARARNEQGRFVAEGQRMGKVAGSVNSVGSAFTSLAAKIGAAFTAYKAVEAAFSGFSKAVNLASSLETTATSFKVLLGSGDKAAAMLGRIKALAAETPFEFPELATAGKSLLAFGESAAEIPNALRRIGDIASGVAAPIGEIAEIYGKARTAGTLFSEDINQLTGRGIPIIRELARVLKEPESNIKKLAEEGKITFPLLDQAFRNLTSSGGQFFGMMGEQSKTFAGLWSTLADGVNELFLELGKPLNDALKPVLADAIGLAGQLKPMFERIGQDVGGLVKSMRDFVVEAESGGGVAEVLAGRLRDAFTTAGEALMIPIDAIGAALPALGDALLAALTPGVMWLSKSMEAAALRMGSVLSEVLADAVASVPGLGGASVSLKGAAFSADVRSRIAAADAEDALGGADQMFALAGSKLGEAMADFKNAFEKKVEAFSYRLGDGVEMGVMPGFQSEGMAPPGTSRVLGAYKPGSAGVETPGLSQALAAVAGGKTETKTQTTATKENTTATKENTRTLSRALLPALGGEVRSKIISRRDGSTLPDGSTKAKGRYMGSAGGGGLDGHFRNQVEAAPWEEMRRKPSQWDQLQARSWRRSGAVSRPPDLTPPGAAKAADAKQKEVSKRVQGQSGGGSSALDEIKRLVAQIEAHTAKLEVVR